MVIFGWGFQTVKVFGAAFKRMCDHCHNEEFWVLFRRITWFTLFFIPMIPYKFERMLLCPVCKNGFELDSEQMTKLQPLAEMNQLLASGQITEVQYREKMASLEGGASTKNEGNATAIVTADKTPTDTEERALSEQKKIFCADCGKNLLPQSNFCVHCGTKVAQPTV